MDHLQPLKRCSRCGVPYDWRRSTSSSLKMTYCSALCEQGDLGFTIEAVVREHRVESPSSDRTLVA